MGRLSMPRLILGVYLFCVFFEGFQECLSATSVERIDLIVGHSVDIVLKNPESVRLSRKGLVDFYVKQPEKGMWTIIGLKKGVTVITYSLGPNLFKKVVQTRSSPKKNRGKDSLEERKLLCSKKNTSCDFSYHSLKHNVKTYEDLLQHESICSAHADWKSCRAELNLSDATKNKILSPLKKRFATDYRIRVTSWGQILLTAKNPLVCKTQATLENHKKTVIELLPAHFGVLSVDLRCGVVPEVMLRAFVEIHEKGRSEFEGLAVAESSGQAVLLKALSYEEMQHANELVANPVLLVPVDGGEVLFSTQSGANHRVAEQSKAHRDGIELRVKVLEYHVDYIRLSLRTQLSVKGFSGDRVVAKLHTNKNVAFGDKILVGYGNTRATEDYSGFLSFFSAIPIIGPLFSKGGSGTNHAFFSFSILVEKTEGYSANLDRSFL